MLMIDCRRCKHSDAGNDCCDIYGSDPRKAVKACADDGFKEYCCHIPQKGHGVKYVLFSPAHDFVREAFTKTDGTLVPEKVFRTSDRALYRHKLFPDRRYRQSFPALDESVQLLEIDSIDQALEEQAALENYCGEKFEIWRWVNGRLAEKVDDVQAERILYGTSDAPPVGILKRRMRMKIPIYCDHCGEPIDTFDTAEDTSCEWSEAPCGEKVCEKCCADCAGEHDPLHACMFRREAGL